MPFYKTRASSILIVGTLCTPDIYRNEKGRMSEDQNRPATIGEVVEIVSAREYRLTAAGKAAE